MQPGDDDLDFTVPAKPAPPPPKQRVEVALKEAEAGLPQLTQTGFLVSMARRAPERVPPKNGSQYVLLAIEDDAGLRKLLTDIFELSGYEVRWAATPTEIVRQLKKGDEVDIMLLDVMLPGANGLDILTRLRAHSRFKHLPVIMMTAKSSAQDVSAGLAAGADGYVSKPFQMSGLVKAVNMVLGKDP